MKNLQLEIDKLKIVSDNQIGIIFNSDGKPLIGRERKHHINAHLRAKINFAIYELDKLNISSEDLRKLEELI